MKSVPFFELDLRSLELHWQEQSPAVREWGLALAERREAYDRAKDRLELVEAREDMRIRESAVGKVTENWVKAQIVLSENYQGAKAKLRRAKLKLDEASAELTALDHRKATLENLVRLHGQQYFSNPSASPADVEAYRQKRNDDGADARVRRAMKKKRKTT
jgi:DNA-binding helix-hairpin-helix protein with protein kinase domain